MLLQWLRRQMREAMLHEVEMKSPKDVRSFIARKGGGSKVEPLQLIEDDKHVWELNTRQ